MLDGHDWLLYEYFARTIINICGSATISGCLSEERVGGGDIRATYIDEFTDHDMKLKFARDAFERFC